MICAILKVLKNSTALGTQIRRGDESENSARDTTLLDTKAEATSQGARAASAGGNRPKVGFSLEEHGLAHASLPAQ